MKNSDSLTEIHLGVPIDQVNEEHVRSLIERRAKESLTLEFKSSEAWDRKNGRDKLSKAISCLANSDGGVLVIRVDEDKGIKWVDIKDYGKDRVEDILLGKIQPSPKFNCKQVLKKGDSAKGIYIVEVEVSYRLIMFDGRFYQRKGARCVQIKWNNIRLKLLWDEEIVHISKFQLANLWVGKEK